LIVVCRRSILPPVEQIATYLLPKYAWKTM
jgi:hypothetical protein